MSRIGHILLVDDEPGIVSALASTLAADGHRVSCASSVEEAIGISRMDPPDVLVTDLRMEGRSGMDLLEVFKEEHPWVRSVVMTGYATVEDLIRCVRLGAVDFVQKPFRIRQIKEAVARCLATGTGRPQAVDLNERQWTRLSDLMREIVGEDLDSAEISIDWLGKETRERMTLKRSKVSTAPLTALTPAKVEGDDLDEVKRLLWS